MAVWERAHEEGRKVPDQFFNRPEIRVEYHHFWKAFSDLTTERGIGMGLGPIPRSKIVEYAAQLGLEGDVAEDFSAVIMKVDSDYVGMVNDPKDQSPVLLDDAEGMKNMWDLIESRVQAKRDGGS